MRTDGNLGHYKNLFAFHKASTGSWSIMVSHNGSMLDPVCPWKKGDLCASEWGLYHNGGDIYQITYRQHGKYNATDLYRGRISDAKFLGKLMNSFQEWDKTRNFHHQSK